MLLNSIQEGRYDLSGDEWGHVSHEARDLISHLLVRDASQRYSADTVLHCSWITQGSKHDPSKPPLQSPRVNFDVSSFLDEANAASRTLAEHANLSSKSEKTGLLGLSPPGNSSLAKRRASKSTIKH
jgi:MAP kinase interacting serine/threonine kinase